MQEERLTKALFLFRLYEEEGDWARDTTYGLIPNPRDRSNQLIYF